MSLGQRSYYEREGFILNPMTTSEKCARQRKQHSFVTPPPKKKTCTKSRERCTFLGTGLDTTRQ